MTRRECIQIFIERVLAWNYEDIFEFANLLYDLDHSIRFRWDAGMDRWEETGEKIADYLELEQLPTWPLPEKNENNDHIWAMDKQGYCLIRMDFDSTLHGHVFNHMIQHIDQLKKHQSEPK